MSVSQANRVLIFYVLRLKAAPPQAGRDRWQPPPHQGLEGKGTGVLAIVGQGGHDKWAGDSSGMLVPPRRQTLRVWLSPGLPS